MKDKKTVAKAMPSASPGKKQNNRFLTIFVCIFLSFVIVLGGTLGIILGVRSARTLASYGGTYIDEGTLSFLASAYKPEYMASLEASGVRVYDSKYFWMTESESGKTYGELLNDSFREYVAGLLVACDLYLSYGDYGREEKAEVRAAAEQVLTYKAEGSKEKFNELAERYGFDYDDFLKGCEILYKAAGAKTMIYGESGENLPYYPTECDKYLETYTHVSLLFIRTEETFLLDSEGNPVYEDGAYVMRPLTDEERAEREDLTARLRAAIAARENGEDGAISPEMFELYLDKSDGDKEMLDKGYYFNPAATETASFYSYHPAIVDKAYAMELGDFAEVECSVGLCFIYKYAPVSGAYSDSENQFFSDFYSDAATYLYALSLSELSEDVRFTEKYEVIDVSLIPKNNDLVINGF